MIQTAMTALHGRDGDHSSLTVIKAVAFFWLINIPLKTEQ